MPSGHAFRTGVRRKEKLLALSKSSARGIKTQGHQVDVVDAATPSDAKLSTYQHIAVGSEGTTWFTGKPPELAAGFLKSAG